MSYSTDPNNTPFKVWRRALVLRAIPYLWTPGDTCAVLHHRWRWFLK